MVTYCSPNGSIGPQMRFRRQLIPLILIVLLGGVLRFRHLDWAKGYYFQPDESVHTIDYLLRMPALNPYEAGAYTYGGLPLYLYLFSARFMTAVTGDAIWGDKWHITLIARAYAAIASTFIILLLYLLSHKLGMSRTAWIPALAFAVSPLAIQYAHYGVVDTLLSFWVVLVSLLSLWALEEKSGRRWIIVGFVWGLAIATKTSALIWGIVLAAGSWQQWRQTRSVLAAAYPLVWGGFGAVIGVMIGSPYYILDWRSFHKIMMMQAGKTVTGQILVTYHWQFLNVRPFLFELEQLGRWTIGGLLGLIAGAGMIGLWKEWLYSPQRRQWAFVLLPATLYFGTIGLWHSKFIRYLLPIVPYVCLSAAWPLDAVIKSSRRVGKWSIGLLTALALLHSAILGTAMSNVYRGPDPRVAASQWMLEHIPPGATILHDPEPLIILPIGSAERYQIQILDLYGNGMKNINNPEFYVQALEGKQYVVIVSRRNYGAIYHLRALFPVAACYYRSLFGGQLGYSLAARFSNYPHIANWVWNTDEAEETFQVFDHPVVYIFQRSQVQTPEQIRSTLEACLRP